MEQGKENEKREQEAAASVLNLLPPPQVVRKMRNFPPKVLNIQYSPRYEPSGAEDSPGKEKKKKAGEETDAKEFHFSYSLSCAAIRWRRLLQFTESRIS